MAEDHQSHGSEAVVSERGLLDVFKKEKDDDQKAFESEDINVWKFKQDNLEKEKDDDQKAFESEDINVWKFKQDNLEKEKEVGDHHHGLKLHGSDGSSSSSDEEEGDSEEKKMKKKEKKSLKDQIKAKICGEEEKPKAEGEVLVAVKEFKKEEVVEGQPPEKKGILEKIKEKMPSGDSAAPPPPAKSPLLADTVAQRSKLEEHCHEGEGPEIETKGIVEKIKEKLPGYYPKSP